MIKSILAIINPISGYSRSRELPQELYGRLRQEGFEINVHLTTGPDDGYQYTLEHAAGYDLVLAEGGDGTVRDVVSAASPVNVPVTVLPTGTENLFAKEMGITADLNRIIETIHVGKTVAFDMAMVNGKRFLMLSGVGFDAEVLLHLNSYRTSNITHLTYFWPIWRTFWEYKFHPLTVEADGELILDDTPALVFVSNNRRYAVNLRICDRAVHDDGLLDVCIYKCSRQFPLVMHAWRTIKRKHIEHKDVVYRQAKKVVVTSKYKMPIETDGDPAGYLPAEYHVLPQAVKVLIPQDANGY